MKENVEKFLAAVKADKALEEEFKKAVEGLDPKARVAAGIAFAQKKGFDIKQEDLIPDEQEVNLDDLDNVAGGTCHCFLGGGGSGDNSNNTHYGCVCVFPGWGCSENGSAAHPQCDCDSTGNGYDY